MKKFLFIIMLSFSVNNFAQQQNANWYFGYHAHLRFTGIGASAFSQPTSEYMPVGANNYFDNEFVEGCATISDYTTGNLKFYSSGFSINGANHLPITNGTGIKGNPSSTQNIVFLPKPNNNNIFYAFTIDGTSGNNYGLFYSEINAVGTPFVTANMKNIPLKDNSGINIDEFYNNPVNMPNSTEYLNNSEAITTVKHSNGVDYWVIAHVNNFIYTYLVDCTGVHLMPSNSYSLIVNKPKMTNVAFGGEIKTAQLQNNEVNVNIAASIGFGDTQNDGILTGTFDRNTGIINFNNLVSNSSETYSLEFSKDGGILYYSSASSIKRYQFSTNQINTLTTGLVFDMTSSTGNMFGMQMAANDVIYVSIDNNRFLGSITNSNSFTSSVYNNNATGNLLNVVNGNYRRASVGLPQLVQWQAPLPPVTLVANNDVLAANSCSTTTSSTPVFANDTMNGTLITSPLSGLVITPLGSTTPTPLTGGITLNPNGTVTVLVGTPAGSYTLPYQICTLGSCPNCSNTGVITVNVSGGGSALVAVNDAFSYDECIPMKMNVKYNNPTNSDTLNGNAIMPSTTGITVQQTPNSLSPIPATGSIAILSTGFVSVGAGTSPGVYTLRYKLILNDNCASQSNEAVVTISIAALPAAQPIVSNVDIICMTGGVTSGISVLDNDLINGITATGSSVVIVQNPATVYPGITLNSNGTIAIAPGTPNGHYNILYLIYQQCLPKNSTYYTKIDLTVGLLANHDFLSIDQNNIFSTGNNVLTNDTYLCGTLDPTTVSLTYVSNPYFSINTSAGTSFGDVSVTPGLSIGSYQTPYTICELANPANCSTTNVYVNVFSSLKQGSSNVTSKNGHTNDLISIYPNPSSGIFNIQMNGQNPTESNFRLSVYNVLGQLVVEKTADKNNAQIDLSNFENGTYFLKIQRGKDTINKIIIKK